VIASNPDGSEPIVPTVGGKIEANTKRITIVPAGQSSARYEIPGFKQLFVSDGDVIVPGQRLTNGSINLHDLIRLQGVEPAQRYIMNEILQDLRRSGSEHF
jgi:DNA-directed RNA polymerase subunit beta'